MPEPTSDHATPSRPGAGAGVWLFFAVTILWSWVCWIPMARLAPGTELGEVAGWKMALLLVGAYGPSLMGLAFSWRWGGGAAVRGLLRSVVAWRVGWRWTLLALGVPWGALAVGALLVPWAGGDLGPADWSRLVLLPVAILAAVPFGPLGEELGWRGFALPRLVERYGAIGASGVVGLVWTVWHTPLFFAPAGTSISGGPITPLTVGGYAVTLVGASVLATWLLWRGTNAVFLAILVHLGFNVDLPLMPFRQAPESADRLAMLLSAVGWVVVVAVVAPKLRGVGRLAERGRSGE